MPNFTKKLRLKKPLGNEAYNIEDFNGNMDIVEAELTEPLNSESLLNENVTSFKVGTGSLNGVNKDYTNEMEKSLVSISGIVGKTEKALASNGYYYLKNQTLSCLYTLDESDSKNYFSSATQVDKTGTDVSSTRNGDNITILGNTSTWEILNVTYKATDLTPGCVYALTVDSVSKDGTNTSSAVTYSGLSLHYITPVSKDTMLNEYRPQDDGNSMVFIANERQLDIQLFVALGGVQNVNGSVTYNNIQLRKVKNYTNTDLSLKSVNDICDVFLGDKVIKRIERYTLNGDEDWAWSDNSKPNTNSFICELPNARAMDKTSVNLNCNKYKAVSDETLYGSDEVSIACGGGTTSNKLVFRVGKGINSTNALKEHLRTSEKDITIEYVVFDVVIPYNSPLLCESGDTLYCDSTFLITCTHEVQLNTKSQIEQLQETLQKEKRSIWSKIKELTNIKMDIGQNGYIVLPILGGIVFQWGRISTDFNNEYYKAPWVTYNVAVNDTYYVDAGQNSNGFINCNCTGIETGGFTVYAGSNTDVLMTQQAVQIKWFSIGRV